MKKANPWSLTYAVIFTLLIMSYTFDDFDKLDKTPFYLGWFRVYYILLNVGNYVYLLSNKVSDIKKIWRFTFPLYILSFILSILEDIKIDEGILQNLPIVIFLVLVFMPTFIWNYKLAYGKNEPS